MSKELFGHGVAAANLEIIMSKEFINPKDADSAGAGCIFAHR